MKNATDELLSTRRALELQQLSLQVDIKLCIDMIWLLGDHKILCYMKSCYVILHYTWIGSEIFLGVLHRQKASCICK